MVKVSVFYPTDRAATLTCPTTAQSIFPWFSDFLAQLLRVSLLKKELLGPFRALRRLISPWVIFASSPSTHLFTRGGRRRKRSEEHTSELQSLTNLVCRLL